VALPESEALLTIERCDSGADPSKKITGSHRFEDVVGGRAADAISVELLVCVEHIESIADAVASGSRAVGQQAVVAADELEQAPPLALRSAVVAAVCADRRGIS